MWRLIAGSVAVVLMLAVGQVRAAFQIGPGTTQVTLAGPENVSGGQGWFFGWYAVDLTNMSGALNLNFGDEGSGTGWEKFHIQIHKDHFGPDGHLLQAYDKWFSSLQSSHGFNSGAVFGPLDIRAFVSQNVDGTWNIVPRYRVPTGSGLASDGSIGGLDVWHTFYEGGYTSAQAFDLTQAYAFAQMDAAASGYAQTERGDVVIPEPSTFIIWFLLGTLGLTVGRWRRRRKAA